ncbi:Plug domain-containing protein [Colwellia sp. MSW7]|uniref:Plug domain-containing protein n=1 Tax=Colwellia maritima TaxID=2912588 RepID=A0ABS9WXT3_9GAMM|nr:Plug domain-containing protein [Colwellia maritima]MCI2282809.1 Plug domain-containing protein [Colwellia maritima]
MKMKSAVVSIYFTIIFPALAQESEEIEKISIYSQTPLSGSTTSERNLLASVQMIKGSELVQSQAISLAEHMKNQLVSLHINDVQNNPFQPDVQYRGFTASPLLGLPQGISVYLNGIRFNEPFGDTVNWDLIPLAALESVALYSGSNPAFGQNTLGGALALQTKNGFSYTQNELDVRFGSFGQKQFTVQSGGNKGNWGYYFIANKYQEDGRRDYSESELKQLLTTLSYANKEHSFDITYAANKNELLGNGAVPEQLPALASRSAIYTQPDKTASRYQQLSLKSDNLINDQMSWQATAYYRHNEINSINGDDSDYEECESGLLYSLCEGEEDDEMEDEAETEIGELERVHFVGYDEDTWLSELTDIDADSIDGTYNTGFTDNKSYGAALQFVRLSHVDTSTFIGSFDNEFIFGVGIDKADIDFSSDTEFAILHNDSVDDDRSVTGIGLFDTESRVRLKVKTQQEYAYFLNTFFLVTNLH